LAERVAEQSDPCAATGTNGRRSFACATKRACPRAPATCRTAASCAESAAWADSAAADRQGLDLVGRAEALEQGEPCVKDGHADELRLGRLALPLLRYVSVLLGSRQ
jgi:hypothetical protein